MKTIYLIAAFLVMGTFSFSQDYSISGTISGLESGEIYLMRIQGDKKKIVDTAFTDQTGSFEIALKDDFPVGQYAIFAGPKKAVELIYNHENIRFVTSGFTASDQVQIIESVENLIYYDYLSIKGLNLYKLDLLKPLLEYYPTDDLFYQEALQKAIQLQQEINTRANKLIEENPNTIVSRFIQVDRPVFADPQLNEAQQKIYLKSNYFNESDFLDTILTRSNILTSKVIGYLSLYQERNLSQEDLENQLVIAVDTVLEKAFANQQVYEFLIDFLIGGFEAIGFEKGLEHIASHNLLSELCVNSERKLELENKMGLIKKLAIGQPAPDFEITALSGSTIKLSAVNAEKTVLVFWASWCPHCEDILPVFKEYYNPENTTKLEIIGISIDESESDWKAAVENNGFNWINIAELKGWDGPIIDDYGVVATPVFFVLDKDKKIIAKPGNERDLRKSLE